MQNKILYKISEKIIPIITWLIITLPIWLSFYHPAVASYLIIGYILYFLYKTIKTIYFSYVSFKILNVHTKIKWFEKISSNALAFEIIHVIIITNYKESYKKICGVLNRLERQTFPLKNIFIFLALEENEGREAEIRASRLKRKFSKKFAGFYTTFHSLAPGEIAGKASNEAFCAKKAYSILTQKGFDPKKIIVTISDADSLFPKEYLANVTYHFINDNDRLYRFYWAPVLLYNNFWKLPLFVRVQSILSSVMRLAYLSQRDDLIQISTYSTNLWLLNEIGYWDVDVIPEDWHIWLQAFFAFGEKVKTIPIFLPITGDPVLTDNIFKTFKNRYEQEKRWAWGVTDIPYSIVKFFESPHIPLVPKLKKLLFLIEIHLMWPTSFFILTISGWIPQFVNPFFKMTVLGFLLPKITSMILSMCSILLIFIIYFDYKLRKKIRIQTKTQKIPLLFFQWYFLPLISFLFSSLPALEAHTRMLIGKRIEYKVTEKI